MLRRNVGLRRCIAQGRRGVVPYVHVGECPAALALAEKPPGSISACACSAPSSFAASRRVPVRPSWSDPAPPRTDPTADLLSACVSVCPGFHAGRRISASFFNGPRLGPPLTVPGADDHSYCEIWERRIKENSMQTALPRRSTIGTGRALNARILEALRAERLAELLIKTSRGRTVTRWLRLAPPPVRTLRTGQVVA